MDDLLASRLAAVATAIAAARPRDGIPVDEARGQQRESQRTHYDAGARHVRSDYRVERHGSREAAARRRMDRDHREAEAMRRRLSLLVLAMTCALLAHGAFIYFSR